MNKKPQSRKGRMIHVRLDDRSHRRLKIHAAQCAKSIQEIVESLIHQHLTSHPGKSIE